MPSRGPRYRENACRREARRLATAILMRAAWTSHGRLMNGTLTYAPAKRRTAETAALPPRSLERSTQCLREMSS